jgi:hypothetical protein
MSPQETELLRAALVGLVGSDDPDELRQMEKLFVPATTPDTAAMLNAIRALLSLTARPASGGTAEGAE